MKTPLYIWQQPGWPKLSYDSGQIRAELNAARRAQGYVEGRLGAIGLRERRQLAAESWAQDAVATAAIEGERLDLEAVRSSVCRRLGVDGARRARAPRHVEGLLDIMEDAVGNAGAALTDARLKSWQQALFPAGFSGLNPVRVNAYRTHPEPMQIVSGPLGREKVHYEAPPSRAVPAEMKRFLKWFNGTEEPDSLVRAALAHLWFETIHPFEDGNGRVGRAIIDLTLARDIGDASRALRISRQLSDNRDEYYDRLQRAQHAGLDATPWVLWFVSQVGAACEKAVAVVDLSLAKARFWATHSDKDLNARQRKAVNALLDVGPGGYEGGMSTRKYEGLTATSRPTASRELIELARLGLFRTVGAGRSTRYYVDLEGWLPAVASGD
jgi:Fic family protein